MLRINGLEMRFGPRVLWSGLDLAAEDGSLVAVVGPSGSGKSTLLNCIGLLTRPAKGEIELNGTRLLGLHARGRRLFRRDHLGYLFQNYALVEDTTVEENLAIAIPGIIRVGRRQRHGMVRALEQVGLADRIDAPIAVLSGGEQQRVAMARLLMKAPDLVLADEPTAALDRANADRVMGYLRAFAQDGGTVLVATHDSAVAEQCDATLNLDAAAPAS